MQNPDDYEPTEAEDWAAAEQHLNNVYAKERDVMLSSFAMNQTFKENGTMQAINTITEAQAAQAVQPLEIIGATEEKVFGGTDMAKAFEEAKANLGGDAVVGETLADVVAATADGTTIKPLTKKQLKAQKHMQKNLQGYMKKAQKQAQTQHILNKLYTHSIRTPEQARQIHAAQLAKAEIIEKLGQRQADAFFAAKPGTKCHDFFPKATIEANPKLMTDVQGESRTLEQVYEYFIYKHFMLLTQKAETPFEGELNTSVDWANTDVKPYVVYEGADVEAKPAETEAKFDQLAQGDVVEEELSKAA